MVKARSLQDLAAIKNTLKAKAEETAALEAARLQAQRRANAEKTLFIRAIGAVTTLDHAPRVSLSPQPAKPLAQQQRLDNANVLRESLSDDLMCPPCSIPMTNSATAAKA